MTLCSNWKAGKRENGTRARETQIGKPTPLPMKVLTYIWSSIVEKIRRPCFRTILGQSSGRHRQISCSRASKRALKSTATSVPSERTWSPSIWGPSYTAVMLCGEMVKLYVRSMMLTRSYRAPQISLILQPVSSFEEIHPKNLPNSV